MNNEQIAWYIILSVIIVVLLIVIVNLWVSLRENNNEKESLREESKRYYDIAVNSNNNLIQEQINKMELVDKKNKIERELTLDKNRLQEMVDRQSSELSNLYKQINLIEPKHKLGDKLTFYDKYGNLISGSIDRVKVSKVSVKSVLGILTLNEKEVNFNEIEYLVNGEAILESELDEATQKKYLEERLHKIEQGLIQTNKKVIKKEGK